MKKILVTGGTAFVSRFVAEHYVKKGYEVFVLNRNSRPQCEGVTLIEADRHALGDRLKGLSFDAVMDVTAYNGDDVRDLLDGLHDFGDYILISSSAVYPEWASQPFTEETPVGKNGIWGRYGTDKIEAEEVLQARVPHAYILRPPYLYGPWNNVYREAFVFDCAVGDRVFYLPREGEMKLQFFYIRDLCRFIDILLEFHPQQRIFNVGNGDTVTVKEWVSLCYTAAGKECRTTNVHQTIDQRQYFSFYDYEYRLDVTMQGEWMPDTVPLAEGLAEAFAWYRENEAEVRKKPFLAFIDENLEEKL